MKKLLLLFSFLTVWVVGMAQTKPIPLTNAFDGRYNDLKGVSISLIEQPGNYYYSIDVKDNPEIVAQILKWTDETEKEASNKVTNIKDGKRVIVLNFYEDGEGLINVGVSYPVDKDSIRMFMQSNKPIKLN